MWQEAKNLYHLFYAVVLNCCFRFPARGMVVVGITGTDGKTTTSSLLYHILSQSGKKVALISTVGAIIDGSQFNTGFHVTTPDSLVIQSYIRKAKDAGVTHLVLEVTSHALDQYRVFGIPFAIGLITNVSHEHLDYHKTYDRYLFAKSRLLKRAGTGILNKDDASYPFLKKITSKYNKRVLTYGMQNADYTSEMIRAFQTKLIGEFNRYNVLAATAASMELGLKIDDIKNAVATFSPPKGRTEIVYENSFSVMIDFAHTPNSFEQLLSTLKKEKHSGRIIHVFGAAGLRDVAKRPLMGEIAGKYDDTIILTAEDPRSESVETICSAIASGVVQKNGYPVVHTISDRQSAIDYAIANARKGDIVVVTGKGHEASMNLGNGETSWSDHEAVQRALRKRNEK